MWFRNLYLFKLDQSFNLNAEELESLLSGQQIENCLSGQRESYGWSSPFGRNNKLLVLANQGRFLIRLTRQQRILPASVVKDHLLERIDLIEAREQRILPARQRRELKEEVEFELLSKAFTKNTHIDAWIDSQNDWLVINTSTPSMAEKFLQVLRNTLGEFPARLPEPNTSPYAAMTQWLSQNHLPNHFNFGHECLFKSMDEDACTVTFKKHTLMGEEFVSNLEAGKFVYQLELIWRDKIRFILTDTAQIKRIKFLDIMTDNLDQQGFETSEEKIDTEFALMIGEVGQMLSDVSEILEFK